MMYAQKPTWGEVYDVPPATTGDDLLRLPDDGSKYELYEGVLIREMTAPGHGDICNRLGGELYLYAKTTGFPHRIVQNSLFDLTPPGAPKRTVLAPDIAIMQSAAAPSWNVPKDTPLLAIEVVSDSQTLAELAMKAQFYRNAGVIEVWVIDHGARVIEIWNAQGKLALDATQMLTSDLLPGFSVAVSDVLDG